MRRAGHRKCGLTRPGQLAFLCPRQCVFWRERQTAGARRGGTVWVARALYATRQHLISLVDAEVSSRVVRLELRQGRVQLHPATIALNDTNKVSHSCVPSFWNPCRTS